MREWGCCRLLWGSGGRREEGEIEVEAKLERRGVDEGENVPGRISLRVRKVGVEFTSGLSVMWL